MALHERNRFATMYHALVAILLLAAGGGLVGYGIWLRITDNGPPSELSYSASTNRFRLALNLSWIAIGVGAFFLLVGLLSLLALARSCVGALFRVLYIVLALVVAAALVGVCAIAAAAAASRDNEQVRDFLQAAWSATATGPAKQEICTLEKRLNCRGFSDNQCLRCPTGLEGTAACDPVPDCVDCGEGAKSSDGCYDNIVDEVRKVARPVAVVAGLLAVVVIVDVVVACML